jgi:hypothetical protein
MNDSDIARAREENEKNAQAGGLSRSPPGGAARAAGGAPGDAVAADETAKPDPTPEDASRAIAAAIEAARKAKEADELAKKGKDKPADKAPEKSDK